MHVKLQYLSDLIQAVKTIRKLSPNTNSAFAFRNGLSEMSSDELYAFCQAIDSASIAVSHVERAATVEVAE